MKKTQVEHLKEKFTKNEHFSHHVLLMESSSFFSPQNISIP